MTSGQSSPSPIIRFFQAETHALNLAVFRIVVFFLLIRVVNVGRVAWFSEFPSALLFPPVGTRFLAQFLPIDRNFAVAAALLLLVTAFLAMVGWHTRASAWLSVILATYVLLIPQLYGKVNHYHHLIWFAAILAASPSGDALSVDAVRSAMGRSAPGERIPARDPARAYALPLRFVWLLLGLIYFFPGFYKFYVSGLDWAFSDNLKYQMWARWFELEGWRPFFRLDQHPALYKTMAFGVVVFEISFIFLVFFKRLRAIAAVCGIAVHEGIKAFMAINFRILEAAYVTFVDWHKVFRTLGRWMYRSDLSLVYDGDSAASRSAAAAVRAVDIFGRVEYVAAAVDRGSAGDAKAFDLEGNGAEGLFCLDAGDERFFGVSAFARMLRRVPLAVLVLPALYWSRRRSTVKPQETAGHTVYRLGANRGRPLAVTALVGGLLVVVNTLMGVLKVENGWPFAAYPSFTPARTAPITARLATVIRNDSGPRWLADHQLRMTFSPERYEGLIFAILRSRTRDPVALGRRLNGLVQIWEQFGVEFHEGEIVEIYLLMLSTDPEAASGEPLRTQLIHRWPIGAQGVAAAGDPAGTGGSL